MHYSIEYWTNWGKAAGVRALKTVAQASIAAIGAATMFTAVDWKVVVSTALLAGILSLGLKVAGVGQWNVVIATVLAACAGTWLLTRRQTVREAATEEEA